MKLLDLKTGQRIDGIDPSGPVEIVQISNASPLSVSVAYRTSSGSLKESILFQTNEPSLVLVDGPSAPTFSGDPAAFRLSAEAWRIRLAHLFDPLMAIHTSDVDPLPHQILAVYDEMLPKAPLRFVLADDPGAGKTIMAGLLIRELMVRGDLERCLIIAPGSLNEQWQTELDQKFNLQFELFSKSMVEASASGNPFAERNQLIARVDQLARNEELIEKLEACDWDLVIVDEAHKMSASFFGNEFKPTKRYKLGERIGAKARHFLLMTATPHNGKEEDFQTFMALLDSDRFYGKSRDTTHQIDTSDLMRRTLKEEMVKFDGTPLFPERIAETLLFELSPLESQLYDKVTDYVRNEMDRVKDQDGKRRGTVGFALTVLQRRLASSPEAIYQSLRRRLGRLEAMLDEARISKRAFKSMLMEDLNIDEESMDDFEDDLPEEELNELENRLTTQATAAENAEQLEAEIVILKDLVELARKVYQAETDSKWRQLADLLEDPEQMKDSSGNRRKLIIFTEHKDTLYYLQDRIATLIGNPAAVEVIHGGVNREERRKTIERFINYAESSILLATDAAGEGVNLQCAHLMVNYDLPWNPNRIEQRFGRIHRIGQTEVCRLWNLVAHETREGQVFQRLFDKLEQERQTLGGKVFDILGRSFEGRPLRDLLLEAIQYGDQPEVRQRLFEVVDHALDTDHLRSLVESQALGASDLDPSQVFHLKERIERAEALRLQPLFIQAFFEEAFQQQKGVIHRRESGRFEISHVPANIRQRDRLIGSKAPVLQKYNRVCFDKADIRLPQKPPATLISPGHPLMDALVDLVLEQQQYVLRRGCVLIDRNSLDIEPGVLVILEHSVSDGRTTATGKPRTISQRLQFVLLRQDKEPVNAGPAPYLDYEAPSETESALVETILADGWPDTEIEAQALAYASSHIVPDHYTEVRDRRIRAVEATLNAVHARLHAEINHLNHRYQQLLLDVQSGKQPKMQPENIRRRAEELTARLEQRTRELGADRHVAAAPPRVLGAALVLPQGLIDQHLAPAPGVNQGPDHAARLRSEKIGMDAVIAHEKSLGFVPRDVSAENLGWDITSTDAKGNSRFLEVKARQKGADTITVTRNEMAVAFNKKHDGWFLALVLIEEDDTVDGPHYIEAPFDRMPGFAETSVNLKISKLLDRLTASSDGASE